MRTRWLALAVLIACGGDDNGSRFDGGDGGETDGLSDSMPYDGPWDDFPKDPIVDSPDGGAGVPANAAMLFGPAGSGAKSGGPCLVEPEIGTMYPKNWLRPRFAWIPAGGANLFELRVTSPNQNNALVV